jgi:hypothetical protein
VRILNAPHLRANKLFAAEKRRANELMIECVEHFAAENGLSIDEQSAERLVADVRKRRAAAYTSYATGSFGA